MLLLLMVMMKMAVRLHHPGLCMKVLAAAEMSGLASELQNG